MSATPPSGDGPGKSIGDYSLSAGKGSKSHRHTKRSSPKQVDAPSIESKQMTEISAVKKLTTPSTSETSPSQKKVSKKISAPPTPPVSPTAGKIAMMARPSLKLSDEEMRAAARLTSSAQANALRREITKGLHHCTISGQARPKISPLREKEQLMQLELQEQLIGLVARDFNIESLKEKWIKEMLGEKQVPIWSMEEFIKFVEKSALTPRDEELVQELKEAWQKYEKEASEAIKSEDLTKLAQRLDLPGDPGLEGSKPCDSKLFEKYFPPSLSSEGARPGAEEIVANRLKQYCQYDLSLYDGFWGKEKQKTEHPGGKKAKTEGGKADKQSRQKTQPHAKTHKQQVVPADKQSGQKTQRHAKAHQQQVVPADKQSVQKTQPHEKSHKQAVKTEKQSGVKANKQQEKTEKHPAANAGKQQVAKPSKDKSDKEPVVKHEKTGSPPRDKPKENPFQARFNSFKEEYLRNLAQLRSAQRDALDKFNEKFWEGVNPEISDLIKRNQQLYLTSRLQRFSKEIGKFLEAYREHVMLRFPHLTDVIDLTVRGFANLSKVMDAHERAKMDELLDRYLVQYERPDDKKPYRAAQGEHDKISELLCSLEYPEARKFLELVYPPDKSTDQPRKDKLSLEDAHTILSPGVLSWPFSVKRFDEEHPLDATRLYGLKVDEGVLSETVPEIAEYVRTSIDAVRKNPHTEKFIYEGLYCVLRTSLLVASVTEHFPSFFNQELDHILEDHTVQDLDKLIASVYYELIKEALQQGKDAVSPQRIIGLLTEKYLYKAHEVVVQLIDDYTKRKSELNAQEVIALHALYSMKASLENITERADIELLKGKKAS